VMVAVAGGRYRPVEVQLGREGGGKTQILAGLAQGQKVVASGQFLLDSEASLSGIEPTPLGGQPLTPPEQRR
jgi:Cu(I)/Ag(I) efflux system membrane fusion protein